jgi:hypothetical protein
MAVGVEMPTSLADNRPLKSSMASHHARQPINTRLWMKAKTARTVTQSVLSNSILLFD